MDGEFVIRRVRDAIDTFIGGVIGGVVAVHVVRDTGSGFLLVFVSLSVVLLFGSFLIVGLIINSMEEVAENDTESSPRPRIRRNPNTEIRVR